MVFHKLLIAKALAWAAAAEGKALTVKDLRNAVFRHKKTPLSGGNNDIKISKERK